MALFRVSREEKVIPGGNSSSPKKTDRAIEFWSSLFHSTEPWDSSRDLVMKDWIWAMASLVGPTTWRTDQRVLLHTGLRRKNPLEREGVHSHPGKELWRGWISVSVSKRDGICCEDGVGMLLVAWICSAAQPNDGCILKQASPDISDVSTYDIQLLPLYRGGGRRKAEEKWGGKKISLSHYNWTQTVFGCDCN